jgi:hypothetical protein
VASATLYCLPFARLRKFGSKVLQLFFIDDFRPAGPKSSIKGRKSTAAPEPVEGLPKAKARLVDDCVSPVNYDARAKLLARAS